MTDAQSVKSRRVVKSFDDDAAMQEWLNTLPPIYQVAALASDRGALTVVVEKRD